MKIAVLPGPVARNSGDADGIDSVFYKPAQEMGGPGLQARPDHPSSEVDLVPLGTFWLNELVGFVPSLAAAATRADPTQHFIGPAQGKKGPSRQAGAALTSQAAQPRARQLGPQGHEALESVWAPGQGPRPNAKQPRDAD